MAPPRQHPFRNPALNDMADPLIKASRPVMVLGSFVGVLTVAIEISAGLVTVTGVDCVEAVHPPTQSNRNNDRVCIAVARRNTMVVSSAMEVNPRHDVSS